MSNYVKDPNAVLDYQWDWSSWLDEGETITTATVTAPDGITVDSQANTTTTVTAWLSGGSLSASYPVTCRVVTSDGRTDDRTISLYIRER
jgi:hypothetical protein